MFKVLLIKEIQSAIVDFRFWVITLLCVSVIPLSFYVSVKNYSQRLSDYLQEVQIYRDSKVIQYDMTAEGIHPPSPLSIFSQGLGEKMPYKVLTSRNGQYTIETARPDNKNDLMGKMDFAYIVVMVLSILAIVFTFNAISGDKESGIFRMVFSNPVLRRQVLAAKLIGNYLVFLIPFLLSLLIALLMVYFSGMVPIFSPQFFPAVLIMLGISMLFLFALFNLGLWVSSSAKSSALSINVLLLIWIVIGLVIPKISPIISGVIYPVESTGVFEGKKAGLIDNITKERRAEEGKLYEEIRAQLHPGTSGIGFGDIVNSEINSEYDRKVLPIREKYESRLASEVNKLTVDYQLRMNRQNSIARAISSLSVINLANNLMAEFSGTGTTEAENFLNRARQFQEQVHTEIYAKHVVQEYNSGNGNAITIEPAEGFDAKSAKIPVMESYQYVPLKDVFTDNLPDILLIAAWCGLFFTGAFISFIRFDVR